MNSLPPTERVFLSAQWRSLVMLNWQIDPQTLASLVPFGTEIDFHEGETFVSIVGFMFLDTRVLGIPIPFHRNFEELNLRFYVRRTEHANVSGTAVTNEASQHDDEPIIKRGVAFVSELVPRWAIAKTARWGYNEKYDAVLMRHTIEGGPSDQSIKAAYHWKASNRWNRISATGIGDAQPLVDGSQEQFIAEHYWGYSQQRDGSTLEYQVKHVPWHVWQATDVEFDCDVAGQYGDRFAKTLSRQPDSAFIADGSAVTVSRPRRIR